MLNPYWGEVARIQKMVEIGKARDEQLNFILNRKLNDEKHFDLYNVMDPIFWTTG